MGPGFRLLSRRALARCEREDGQALIEYALILMLVAMVCVTVLSQIGINVVGPLDDAAQALL